MTHPKPVVLCILDGWGKRAENGANAPALANTPGFDRIMATCPSAELITHGPDVGLPRGQMGNSEVGHTNIGAGRVVAMDLGQIDLSIEEGTFQTEAALVDFIETLKASGGTAHLMGLVSDGGVHGHLTHIIAAVKAVTDAGVPVALHAVTDGRDVAPKSALTYLAQLKAALPENARIATVTGRYYAMDRDNRWERVELAYNAIVFGNSDQKTSDTELAIKKSYGYGV
ncbi:MAG: 2,3-bisphosphoglycerate-independent phosphoglycerate mutase, partial [Pseudomonadota bacterium]|nr:2,3-bisphosphoglycerate-independent phosphoglycerate mutase [Pseudomonadota bacterium]